MDRKVYCTNVYAVYHRSESENENMPCFFKGPKWDDKCTYNFHEAFVTDDIGEAEAVANALNNEAKKHGHCLAGHIKFGKICVMEMNPMEI